MKKAVLFLHWIQWPPWVKRMKPFKEAEEPVDVMPRTFFQDLPGEEPGEIKKGD